MYLNRASRSCYYYYSLAFFIKSSFRCDAFANNARRTTHQGLLLSSFSSLANTANAKGGLNRINCPRIFRAAATAASTTTSNGSTTRLMSSSDEIDKSDLVDVAANYLAVKERVDAAVELRKASNTLFDDDDEVRLVAVSKTKPLELLQAAYEAGCLHFGENYVQEMIDKVEMWSMNCVGVHWHFIGTLQSNKCTVLVKCMASKGIYLFTVETVGSENLAKKLNNAVMKVGTDGEQLKVFVQVNTSGEDSKGGVQPGADCLELCRYIAKECPGLLLRGLMTIGAPDDTNSFSTLVECRDSITQAFRKESILIMGGPLELSMGMSGDFEQAIAAGATNVRVGSTIFGNRVYSTEPVVKQENKK